MTNKDLIAQYVDTGFGIPRYQFDKLSNNDKKTYLRKLEISIEHNTQYVHFYYGELPERTQLIVVKDTPHLLSDMINPTEKTQITALLNAHTDELDIIINDLYRKGIKPSEAVQLAAVKIDGFLISNFEDPSEAVQLAAVNENGHSIQYIKNPTDKVKLIAKVVTNYSYIESIDNPSEELQLIAIKNDERAINYIKTPTDKAIALHSELWG